MAQLHIDLCCKLCFSEPLLCWTICGLRREAA